MIKPLLVHISPELHKKVKLHCLQNDLSMKDFVSKAVEVFLLGETKTVKSEIVIK